MFAIRLPARMGLFRRQIALSSRPKMVAARLSPRSGVRVLASSAEDLPTSLQGIVMAFQMVPDPMQRYKQLLYYASKLEPLPVEDHVPELKVQGCVSQVWVKSSLKDGRIFYQADSDSQLTKGLAALLVKGLSGCTADEICDLTPDFIEMLGLKQSLTPSRNNGFLNMLRMMQKQASLLRSAQQVATE